MARGSAVPYDEAPPAPSGAVSQDGSGAQPLRLDASASAFGGSVGAATENVGNQFEQNAQHLTGMVMETAANQAEIESVKQSAPLIAKYKSLEGLQAFAAAPQFEQDMLKINEGIRAQLPGMAQKMFDANTSRRTAYSISDYHTYAAQQVKKATLDSNNALAETAISHAGDPSVANDDNRFGAALGDIKHSVSSMMDLQGYGGQVTTDPATGKVSFSDTPEGQRAQSVYESEINKRVGAAWESRLRSLSEQNVASAYQKFDDNRSQIPGEAQVKLDAYFTPKMRDYNSRGIADDILKSHDQQYQSMVSKPDTAFPSTTGDIADAIHQQESSGRAHDYQIQPGTFAQYAKPGESADNPTDQDKVYGRIIKDLKDSYPNDPARQAVAYFSGKGNVSLPGSPTPWKVDKTDGNKTVSQYVSDIQGRLGKSGGVEETKPIQSTALVPSQADYYRTNYDKIIEEARTQAQAKHPDDPGFADNAVSKVEQRMNTVIKSQELAYKADNDTVMRAFNGDFSKGARPTSVEQLRASSPDAAAAWDRLTVNNPMAANTIENRLLTANAKGSDKDSREYGSGFYKLFQQVHASLDSPDRIHSVDQLYSHVGPDGDLTVAGLGKLREELAGKGTPEGEAEKDMRKQFFANAKGEISGKNDMLNIPDKKGEEQNLKFMAQAFPLIDKLKAEGKTAAQIYNPDSPDYVGKLIPAFKRPPNVQLQDMNRDAVDMDLEGTGTVTADKANGKRTPAVIVAEARATTDPAKREALKQELIKLGKIRDDSNDLKVPRPE